MSLTIRDGISPELARRAALVRDRRQVLEAMGLEFVSLTKRAFTNAALRPAPWAKKKDGTPATLRKSGALWHSIKITATTDSTVTVSSDRPYAAIHQIGGVIRRARKGGADDSTLTHAGSYGDILAALQSRRDKIVMPARPYFPVLSGKLTPEAKRRIEAVAKAKIDSMLR